MESFDIFQTLLICQILYERNKRRIFPPHILRLIHHYSVGLKNYHQKWFYKELLVTNDMMILDYIQTYKDLILVASLTQSYEEIERGRTDVSVMINTTLYVFKKPAEVNLWPPKYSKENKYKGGACISIYVGGYVNRAEGLHLQKYFSYKTECALKRHLSAILTKNTGYNWDGNRNLQFPRKEYPRFSITRWNSFKAAVLLTLNELGYTYETTFY